MDDLLELEAPEIAEEPEVLELADDSTPEGADEAEQPEGEQPATDKTPVTSLVQADGKKLDPTVSKTLLAIKADNPELGKLLTRAVYRSAEVEREFPGGLTEAREMRDKVEEFGGLEGIQEKLDGVQQMDTLAKQYMDADPAFVEDLIESSPEAFAALAPIVAQKWAEGNPEGFSAYLGRIVYGDMQNSQVPLMMMRMGDLIPADNPKLKEAFDAINGYLGGFKTLAEKPMAAKTAPPATPKKQDDLSRREQDLRSKEWQTERDTLQKGIVNTEYNRLLAGRTPDTEEKAQIRELFLVRSKAAADRLFPGWEAKAQRFISNNDKAGYLRYMGSIYRKVVPDSMASSVNSTFRGKKAPVPATGVKKPAAATHRAATAAPAGYAPLPKEPSTWDIDFGRTTQDMLKSNRAVLKDGKKVSWK